MKSPHLYVPIRLIFAKWVWIEFEYALAYRRKSNIGVGKPFLLSNKRSLISWLIHLGQSYIHSYVACVKMPNTQTAQILFHSTVAKPSWVRNPCWNFLHWAYYTYFAAVSTKLWKYVTPERWSLTQTMQLMF